MDRKCRVEGKDRALINRRLACGTDISVSMCICGRYVCMGWVDRGWVSRCVHKLYRWYVLCSWFLVRVWNASSSFSNLV
jgi:hypothetical protein